MKEDKEVKVDLSFFFFFFVSQTRDKRERFPFLRIAFQRLAELCSVAKFCCWTRSLENKKLRHFRWKFEKLKLKEGGNSEGESFVTRRDCFFPFFRSAFGLDRNDSRCKLIPGAREIGI